MKGLANPHSMWRPEQGLIDYIDDPHLKVDWGRVGILGEGLEQNLIVMMDNLGREIGDSMLEKLEEKDHMDSFRLANSIHCDTNWTSHNVISTVIRIDARNQDNNAWYADFIEHGSGKYRDTGRGRQGGWMYIYKGYKLSDDELKWCSTHKKLFNKYHGVPRFTYGIKADPFIEPSVENAVKKLSDDMRDAIMVYYK